MDKKWMNCKHKHTHVVGFYQPVPFTGTLRYSRYYCCLSDAAKKRADEGFHSLRKFVKDCDSDCEKIRNFASDPNHKRDDHFNVGGF